jgi:phage shock protein A
MIPDSSLAGMSAEAAKEYVFGLITSLKLAEKEIQSMEDEAAKWKARLDLARSRGAEDLLREAEKEEAGTLSKLAALREEARDLKDHIAETRRQIPGLAARQRSIDPDLLEQELLSALGRTEEETGTERAFRKLEQEGAAGAALEALKAKMKEAAP